MDNFTEADVPEPTERFTKLINIYYAMKNTVDMEIPYWYNRVWWENEGDVIEIRRAKSLRCGPFHTTPTIWPGEKLVMNKTKNWRGAFPFPWVDASFFNAQAEALMNEADAPPLAAADAVSVVGAGGGNVTKEFRQRDFHCAEIWYAQGRDPRAGQSVQVLGQCLGGARQ